MIQWVGETLFATTVLMLLILAIRPFVADRFGARRNGRHFAHISRRRRSGSDRKPVDGRFGCDVDIDEELS